MKNKEYKYLKDRECFFWWDVGRRHILRKALKRHTSSQSEILDIGCGAGGNMLFLKEFGEVTGMDVSDEALKYAFIKSYKDLVQGSATELPFPDNSFNIISLLDVLEHIDEEEKTILELFRVLKVGGILLLTVPAFMWMWSDMDRDVHHKRRYRKNGLLKQIREGGFRVKEASYFVMPAVPARAVKILIGKKDSRDDVELPVFLNSLLIIWLRIESYVMNFFPLPFGSSILVVAEKKW